MSGGNKLVVKLVATKIKIYQINYSIHKTFRVRSIVYE